MDEARVRCHGTTRRTLLALFALKAPLLKALTRRGAGLGQMLLRFARRWASRLAVGEIADEISSAVEVAVGPVWYAPAVRNAATA